MKERSVMKSKFMLLLCFLGWHKLEAPTIMVTRQEILEFEVEKVNEIS